MPLASLPPRARRAIFLAYLDQVDPRRDGFDMRDTTEHFAQNLDPPLQGVAFLRMLLEELEDRTWGVASHLVDRLLTSLPEQLKDSLSDELIFVRVPQAKWGLFRPADWVYERQLIEGASKKKVITILHIEVEPVTAPVGQERLHLILEADDLRWIEQRFRLIHRRVDYDEPAEQERLLASLFGPAVLEPILEEHLRYHFHRDRRILRSTARLERYPERFTDLARPSFEVSLTVVFQPHAVDQPALVRRLKDAMAKIL